jgi:hypothetical protein
MEKQKAKSTMYPQNQEDFGGAQAVKLSSRLLEQAGFPNYFANFNIGFDAAWELDFWGRFRRNVEATDAAMLATAALRHDGITAPFILDGPRTRASRIRKFTSTSKPRDNVCDPASRQQRLAGEDRLSADAPGWTTSERGAVLLTFPARRKNRAGIKAMELSVADRSRGLKLAFVKAV